MQSKVLVPVGDPRLMDISMYGGAAIMALLGISALESLTMQFIVLTLCLAYALLYRFLFRTRYYERQPASYFGTQVIVVVLLFLLKPEWSDAFTLMFYSLAVQAAIVLPIRSALAWTVLYFVISSAAVLLSRGTDGFFAVFFFVAAFLFCTSFGHALQRTILTSERNKRLVEELQDAQQKLKELAIVDERNRLARDLHDSVKQQVFAISMQLSAARTAWSETEKAYASVIEAERLAQQAGAELTTLIQALRPPELANKKSLLDALRGHVEAWSRQTGIAQESHIDASISAHAKTEHALFRVLQEALANVARHSQARKVTVSLQSDGENVVLTVEDDGIGMDINRNRRGVGLASMNERLMEVNGKLEIESQPSRGTRIIATARREP